MKLIGVIEMFNRGIGIIISRIVPVALVRLIHIFIAMAVGAWGSRGLMEALRAASPEGMPVGPHNIQEVLASLPQEQVFDAVLSPALWIAVVVNIIVFLWAQAALYLALYPNAKNPA
ncbi:MAG: hypothetical protein HY747_06770 [Elusimicrobia bacterium]|nr:hypothetical protein [Elusimicrobiota bacterium]